MLEMMLSQYKTDDENFALMLRGSIANPIMRKGKSSIKRKDEEG